MERPFILPQIIFIQNTVHLAGAQKSLSRLLTHPEMRLHTPVLLTGHEGWLTDMCREMDVRYRQLTFPKSRTLWARLLGNRAFAKRAAQALRPLLMPGRPLLVHANDHPDSLLALALAKELKVPSILTLRTPGMSQRDFDKYHCGAHRHLIAVGDDLHSKVLPWAGDTPLSLIHNGVTEAEILLPISEASQCPNILCLGSIIPRKGWQDLIEALLALEPLLPAGALPEIHFLGDLLGHEPGGTLGVERLRRFTVRFLGVEKNYRDRLRGYSLAVHPSRNESFGMAALECIAAGVPLLAATTGLIPHFVPKADFLFPPGDSASLAQKLQACLCMTAMERLEAFDMPQAQAVIRQRFSTDATVRGVKEVYQTVLSIL